MDRIFFAFPEERQKVSFLFEGYYKKGYHTKSPSLFLMRKRDCPFTLSSGKSENKNPKDPVNPV